MFPVHTEIAYQLAREHAAEERRLAEHRRLVRDTRRAAAARRGPLAALVGFLRRHRGSQPADQTRRHPADARLPQARQSPEAVDVATQPAHPTPIMRAGRTGRPCRRRRWFDRGPSDPTFALGRGMLER